MGLVWARIDISGQHPREDMMRVSSGQPSVH